MAEPSCNDVIRLDFEPLNNNRLRCVAGKHKEQKVNPSPVLSARAC